MLESNAPLLPPADASQQDWYPPGEIINADKHYNVNATDSLFALLLSDHLAPAIAIIAPAGALQLHPDH
jgi:hypothetical protein